MRDITPSIIKRINDSNSIENLRENLKIENDQDIFNTLLEYLDLIVEKYDNVYKETSYKIIKFLEQLATEEINNVMNKCSKIVDEKYKIIDILKNDDNNLCDKEIVTLKELANKLENLQVNISFKINHLSIIENYNVVKYLLFKEKNINLSIFLIDNNSYLIEAFNKNNENILVMITESYLNAIETYVKDENCYDITYFDALLEKILKNDKITKDKKVMETCIHMAMNYDRSKYTNGKELNKAIPWYKHLERKLDNTSYEADKENLNTLYGVSPYFKSDIREEGHTLGSEDNIFGGFNKNGDYIITIDNENAFDMDDAISIKKENGIYKLKIYIADPNSFCLEDGLLMNEARRRVETIYSDKESVGIFPHDIVSYYMSLSQNANRYARVYEYDISENGIIIDFKIKKQVINVSHNYSYEEFDNALLKSNEAVEYMTIQNLLDLNSIIKSKYLKDNNTEEVTSKSILEAFILFNNTKVAEFFSSRGIPFIYKYHAETDTRLMNVLETLGQDKKYRKIIKEAMKDGTEKAYSTNRKSHEGLNFKYYCHSTSPLHSYADILLNKCEDTFYFNNPSDKEAHLFETYLNDEVDYINDKILMLDRYRKKYEKAKVRARK